MNWVLLVVRGYKYLVRLHFCDIASILMRLLYFNVYVNGYLAFEYLDLSLITCLHIRWLPHFMLTLLSMLKEHFVDQTMKNQEFERLTNTTGLL
ncbi:hypothetical protein MtrunA17_Chr7g0248141 [Medicago truncatula]|uniref:Carbohydrate-binding protein of the ER protein n=1 Tax=Medicago truncatula TaxID=3880 RepID=A2Q214_MEDTR|nr:hypothetical protein MtrDRAFT_AC149204g22v2 [Medicago truncatula]AES80226.1 carbohydrate-binding protein of the ER protein [Medicago truncatula]RHN46993.1 hypothetical protein MtrunA17_Chr7g0248141 [Medicago truncatula]